MVTFWQYLKREYQLSNADAIIKYLHQVEPKFKSIMNDSSKFGMAKSFMMMGKAAGFDMSTEAGINEFMMRYNANLASQGNLPLPPGDRLPGLFGERSSSSKIDHSKKKKRRKMAKSSRKKNRKK
jgi:hypothetical protein